MHIQNTALAVTVSACPNSAHGYLLALAPALPELALLIVLEVALWMV